MNNCLVGEVEEGIQRINGDRKNKVDMILVGMTITQIVMIIVFTACYMRVLCGALGKSSSIDKGPYPEGAQS